MKKRNKLLLLSSLMLFALLLINSCSARRNNDEVKADKKAQEENSVNSENKEKKVKTKKPPEKSKEEKLLEKMTLDEKIGQLFIARCPEKDAASLAKKHHLGGYILFARDFKGKTKDAIVKNIKSYQDASEIKMFIAVDEEGGTVNRVSTNKNLRKWPFASPQYLFKKGGMDLIKKDTEEKSKLLKSIGINVNFAPVADIAKNKKDFMYRRSFARSAEETATYVKNVVTVMNKENIGSVLKHFPGYGNNKDTHTDLVHDKRKMDQFKKEDFIPFKAGIDAKASMVLVSHNIVEDMDKEKPASISKEVHRILREDLKYDGIIITDDLAMQGIKKYAKDVNSAVLALKADNDMLCSTSFIDDIKAVKDAVNKGEIKEEDINKHVLRVLRAKINLGIIK